MSFWFYQSWTVVGKTLWAWVTWEKYWYSLLTCMRHQDFYILVNEENSSREIPITEGVLQGVNLRLFLYLRYAGILQCPGAWGNFHTEYNWSFTPTLCTWLGHPIQSYTWPEAQNKLRILESYCWMKKIQANIDKTVVLAFQKRVNLGRHMNLTYQTSVLQVVNII